MIMFFAFIQIRWMTTDTRTKYRNKQAVNKKKYPVLSNFDQRQTRESKQVGETKSRSKVQHLARQLPSRARVLQSEKFLKSVLGFPFVSKSKVRVKKKLKLFPRVIKNETKLFRFKFLRRLLLKKLWSRVQNKNFKLNYFGRTAYRSRSKHLKAIFSFFRRNIWARSKKRYAFRLFYLFCKLRAFDRKINPGYDKELAALTGQSRKHRLPRAYLFKYKKLAYKISKLWLTKYFTKPRFKSFLYRIGRNPWWKKGAGYKLRTLKFLKKFEKVVSKAFPVKVPRFVNNFKYVSHREFTKTGLSKPNFIQSPKRLASKFISPFKLLVHHFPQNSSSIVDFKKLVPETFIRSPGYFVHKFSVAKRRTFFTNSVRRFPRAQLKRAKFNFSSPIYFKRRYKSLLVTTKLVSRRPCRLRPRSRYRRRRFAKRRSSLSKKIEFSFASLPQRPIRSLRATKKSVRFYPFLGVFSKYGRISYKLRRRRIKFKKFFGKYFRTYEHFYGTQTFRYRRARTKFSKIEFFLHVFRSVNNLFVNVSASRGRSIFVYSAGRTQYRGSKRLSPVALETMGRTVSSVLKSNKIAKIFIVFHSPIDYLTRALLRGLRSSVLFSGFQYYLNKPHNGLRKRASRRV